MRIETICTGDELLTGLTSDTNSRFFQALLLAHTGQTVRRNVVVGDHREDIIEALNQAAQRCDAVLVSGGLGPTTDDITVACAAEAAGVAVIEHPGVRAHLEARYLARGMKVTHNNLQQAHIPLGSEVELNGEGSAPLIIQQRGPCTFFFVPGVPAEYRHLVERHVVPRLAARARPTTVRVLTVLKTVGLPESHLDALMRPLAPAHPRVTFGYRTHPPENHLKLLAEAATRAEAQQALASAVADARAVLQGHCFGENDQTLPSVVLEALRRTHARLALAESCTGGLIAKLLTDVPGSSDVLYGCAVTYADAAKTQWATVSPALLHEFTAVSAQCAEAMARGIRAQTQVDYGLSITGYAGPAGGTAQDPAGTVYLGLATPDGSSTVKRLTFQGDRDRVRRFAAHAALDLLRKTVESARP